MTTRRDGTNGAALEACECSPRTLRALSTPRRRAVVAEVLGRDAPVAVDRLASRLADRLDAPERDLAVSLRHADLPALGSADLVAVDDGRETVGVGVGSSPDVRDGPLTRSLLAAVDGAAWTALDALHRARVRPAALAWLDAAGPTLTTDELVARLDVRPAETASGSGPAPVDELALRHQHLPRLDDVGLLAHDAGEGAVADDTAQWVELSSLVDAVRRASAGPIHPSLATQGDRPPDGVGPTPLRPAGTDADPPAR
jgi:hypothetical protein